MEKSNNNMERVLRIPHFTKDSKTPKSLDLLLVRPTTNPKGYIDEGKLIIMVDDGSNRIGFQLTSAEASLLYQRLGYALNILAEDFHSMNKDSRRQSSGRRSERNNMKEEETDEYPDDFSASDLDGAL